MADDETKTTTTTTIMEDTGKKDAPSDSGEKRKRKKNKGFLVRLWNGIFGRRGEDYEKRLQYLSKEEAAVHARMKRRAQGWRKTARNVILCSVVAEVAAVIYAILMTRSVELSWQMRSLRVLPMFAFPGFSYVIYSTLASFTRMRDRKDQNTLESLRAERQAKINELKEKTNYYTTQQLIQQYDLDPAAKAAAATVLASKLGADSGLKVFLGDESNANASLEKSNDVELVKSDGLRNRKQSGARSQGTGTSVSQQFVGDETAQDVSHGGQEAAFQGQRVVEHYRGSGPNEGGWIARLAAMLVGEDPSQSYALICGNCRMHNGLAKKEDFPYITYYCPHCQAFNGPSQSDNPGPGPGSPFCNVIAPSGDAGIARTISNTSSTVSEADASKQHLEGNTGREPDEQKVE